MGLISVSIPNLISGVSQQPDTLRLETSCTEMINAWPSVVTGLSKRPPTEVITKLNVNIDSNGVGYLIDRDGSYRFIVVIDNGTLKVFDIFGNEQTVNFPDGKGYLQRASSPVEDFRFLTVGDYTFILNRDVPVKEDDYGELGAGNYIPPSPGGVVQLQGHLPDSAPNNSIWLVDSTDAYYRRVNISEKQEVVQWVASGGWTETPPVDTTPVSKLPNKVVKDRRLRLFKTVIDSTRSVKKQDPKTKKWKWVKVNSYKTTYRLYIGTVTTPYRAPKDDWIWLSKRKLMEQLNMGLRLNPQGRASVLIKQSVANSYYNIYINEVQVASYLTPKGVDAASSVPGTAEIAHQLWTQLSAGGYLGGLRGSTIVLHSLPDGASIVAQGPQGDGAMKAYTTTVQQFSDLPPNELQGRLVQVKGSIKDSGDDYWVEFDKGIWKECMAYGAGSVPAASTMPWVLVREDNGTWTFRPHQWLGRPTGDEESNPGPSFLGFKLNDIFIYANRLGFIADENVILSEAGEFENFYRTTLTTQLDSDPIDIAVLNTGNDILYHAVPFNKDLILASDRNQYRLTYQQYLSAKTLQIQFTTSFNMSDKVKPYNMGGSIYFVDDKPTYNFAKVWEYFPKETQAGDDAEDATAPIPEYIHNQIKFMASSTRAKSLVLGSAEMPNILYVYKFYWNGERKIQNAWQTWEFPDCSAVYWAGFSQDYLYLLIHRGDGIYLERVKFDENVTRAEVSQRILVDRQVQKDRLTITFNPLDGPLGASTVTLPYSTDLTPEVVASWYGGTEETTVTDLRHVVTKLAPNVVKVTGDLTTAQIVTCGIPYTFRYVFTTPYLRQNKGNGKVVVLDGTRLQLRYMTLEYMDTAFFQTVLKYPGREDVVTTFDGKITGDATFIVGTTPYVTGKFRVPLVGNNKDCTLEIRNDSPYNCSFGAAEWTAVFAPRVDPRARF